MKTSTLIGISLTLLMLLLVLLSAFLFNYQGRQAVEQTFASEKATLEKRQADSDLQMGILESTRVATEQQLLTPQAQQLATVQAENSLLNEQSVADLQELEELRPLATQAAALGTPLPTIASEQRVVQPSIIEILSPENSELVLLNSDVVVIIAARDERGIDQIELMINGQLDEIIPGNGDTFITYKKSISFVSAGSKTLEAKLVNNDAGETSSPLIEINVELPTDNGG